MLGLSRYYSAADKIRSVGAGTWWGYLGVTPLQTRYTRLEQVRVGDISVLLRCKQDTLGWSRYVLGLSRCYSAANKIRSVGAGTCWGYLGVTQLQTRYAQLEQVRGGVISVLLRCKQDTLGWSRYVLGISRCYSAANKIRSVGAGTCWGYLGVTQLQTRYARLDQVRGGVISVLLSCKQDTLSWSRYVLGLSRCYSAANKIRSVGAGTCWGYLSVTQLQTRYAQLEQVRVGVISVLLSCKQDRLSWSRYVLGLSRCYSAANKIRPVGAGTCWGYLGVTQLQTRYAQLEQVRVGVNSVLLSYKQDTLSWSRYVLGVISVLPCS